jgi:hypothetical protein
MSRWLLVIIVTACSSSDRAAHPTPIGNNAPLNAPATAPGHASDADGSEQVERQYEMKHPEPWTAESWTAFRKQFASLCDAVCACKDKPCEAEAWRVVEDRQLQLDQARYLDTAQRAQLDAEYDRAVVCHVKLLGLPGGEPWLKTHEQAAIDACACKDKPCVIKVGDRLDEQHRAASNVVSTRAQIARHREAEQKFMACQNRLWGQNP